MTSNEIHFDTCENLGEHLEGRKINCILTDPPFGVDVSINFAETPKHRKINEPIENDGDAQTAIATFDRMLQAALPHLADEVDIYSFCSWQVLHDWHGYFLGLGDQGLILKGIGVWNRGYPGLGDLRASWGMGHEFIFYLKKGRRPVQHRRSFVLAHDRVPSGQNIHPTEKPVALLRELIQMSTDPEDLILDPFSGSGSTSVAAQELGRNSIAFEIDERFIAPSRARLESVGLGLTY